ncbi:hypothetical protein FRX31_013787 [Thalictrum thalictroides]|uniref:Uncharacterized protein n=1 Tax=Thalictrum thalictroides TaxID=46969 RepID=A0A7J6WGR0_THATH|nr:hypothetical protein FRX31_013787 [Thalictrum thalictroides]
MIQKGLKGGSYCSIFRLEAVATAIVCGLVFNILYELFKIWMERLPLDSVLPILPCLLNLFVFGNIGCGRSVIN